MKQGLVLYGRNFDAIAAMLNSRMDMQDGRTDGAAAMQDGRIASEYGGKNTDQVRKWFYNHRESENLDAYLAKHDMLYG
jgi:hypothetical protein